MTFGLISIESGKLLASYESQEAALEAVQMVLRDEPDAEGSVAVVTFDDHGHPQQALRGDELSAALQQVPA